LLSTTVARDFGWIGTLETVERLEATLQTMSDLRRVRGHFLNWYDTQDLRPLEPMYVSTVDSGNLAGHLIALAQACRELMHRPRFGPRFSRESGTLFSCFSVRLPNAEHPRRTRMVTATRLREAVEAMSAALQDTPTSFPEWARRFRELESGRRASWTSPASSQPTSRRVPIEILAWAEAVRGSVRSHARDLEAANLGPRLSGLSLVAEGLIQAMDFQFLFDSSRKLFSIGYRVADGTLDPSDYDLLASESRLAASWPSPRATFRPNTGSSSADLSRRSVTVAALCRGPGPCSSTSCLFS